MHRVTYKTEKTHVSRRGGLRLVKTNKITCLNEQVTDDVGCCQGLLERWTSSHPKGCGELTHMPVVNVLRHRNPNGPSSAWNHETELVINKCTGLSTERKSTKDEMKTLPLKAKKSLRWGMQQHVLITILVVEGRLEVVGKDTTQAHKWLSLKGRSQIHKFKYLSLWHNRGLVGSTVNGKTKCGEATRSTGPQTAITLAVTYCIVMSLINSKNLVQVAELMITTGGGMSESQALP